MVQVSVIVPSHNEEENLPILVERLGEMIRKEKLSAEVVLVDDNSTDRTPEVCEKLSKKYKNVRTIHRKSNPGMGAALKEGSRKAHGEYVVWVMADLADDLYTIPDFVKKLDNGADLVFGSRYMPGGSGGDIQWIKKRLSSGFTHISRLFLGLRVHDITNAFRGFKKVLLEELNIEANDFAISPEFALKAHLAGYNLDEVPTSYKKRVKGLASFRFGAMGKRYVGVLLSAVRQR